MKYLKSISHSLVALTFLTTLLFSCDSNPEVAPTNDILPETFGIDIPSSISNEDALSSGRMAGRTEGDTLNGGVIYINLVTFIAVGDGASKVVNGIMHAIRRYNINRPMTLSYESDDDGRTKNLVVTEDVPFDGQTWEYQLAITDAESEGNDDGGKGLQIFWNTSPVKGIAILKPYNIDRRNDDDIDQALFRIDYSEEGDLGYDAHMEVSITELPLPSVSQDRFAMETLKMFVGRKGDIIDVTGHSNHPNASFFTQNTGFNWAFAASGSEDSDIAVVEVGLPPSDLDASSHNVLLHDYALKTVFVNEITEVWPWLSENALNAYLADTEGPGYFGKDGFISGGTSPGEQWDLYEDRLENLAPFNPKDISNLEIAFR